jgi:hypothetical protein
MNKNPTVPTLFAVALCVPMLVTSGCGSSDSPDPNADSVVRSDVPARSGAQLVAYHLRNPQWPMKAACGTTSMNVIVERPVSDQELIDLALDLHARYPKTYFEILDSESRIKDFDQLADLVRAARQLGEPRLKALIASMKPWEEKHNLATIAIVAEEGGVLRWQLMGADAHPTKADERICYLDAKTISRSECVAAASGAVD